MMRIVLSTIFSLSLLLSLAACGPDSARPYDDDPAPQPAAPALIETGIGTSPTASLQVCPAPLLPCGLWASEFRHLNRPDAPDVLLVQRPGGLSCSALIAASESVPALAGSVVYPVSP